jgi:colanic acid/amylovoran biosynthesis glycosyltransferase
MMKKDLVIIPSVAVWIVGDKFAFDRKFYDGMIMYGGLWPGSMRCILRVSNEPFPEFGVVYFSQDELSFEILLLQKKELVCDQHIRGAAIVLASGDAYDQLHISSLSCKAGIKCVYVIENIVETRYQITKLETKNLLLLARRYFFIWNTERKRQVAFQLADGLQTNGVPAYKAYGSITDSLLYFDTRVTDQMLVTTPQLNQRLKQMYNRSKLHLAYSGRLISMKGADQLVELADCLRTLDLEFHLHIFGVGDLFMQITNDLKKYSLTSFVTLHGSVDFNKELIPAIRKNIDLYILPHRQSDPSCTYLETLSCGIPIVGYNNKAFSGLLDKADIGWQCDLGNIRSVAETIVNIALDRKVISNKSHQALSLARLHDFNETYKRRVEQLIRLSRV